METQLTTLLMAELPKLGPWAAVLFGIGYLVWKLGVKVTELKDAAFQTRLDGMAARVTTLENKLNAAEIALVRVGAWNSDTTKTTDGGKT